jgi:hypothetical protein
MAMKTRDTIPGSGLGRVLNQEAWGESAATARYGGGTKTFPPPEDRSGPQRLGDSNNLRATTTTTIRLITGCVALVALRANADTCPVQRKAMIPDPYKGQRHPRPVRREGKQAERPLRKIFAPRKALPLSATLTLHGTNLGRSIVYTVPRDLVQNLTLSRPIRIRSRTNNGTRMRQQVPQFCFWVRWLGEPDAPRLGLNLDRRNQGSNSEA